MSVLYLDNAATSWPKPEAMLEAMIRYQQTIGASPGRSGHRLSIEAGRIVFETRERLAELLGVANPLQIVFTQNATEAINTVLSSLLAGGGHIVTTAMEHNAVMRPLRFFASKGANLTVVACSPQGELDPEDIRMALRPETKAVIMTHASNVTGTIMPVREVGVMTRERGIVLCVDAAQTAGALNIDVEDMHIDLLAFTGHKSLYGPQGTGGLYIRKGLDASIDPLMRGGTGSRSEFEEQPDFMPDKYECGTTNTIGLAGLHAGVSTVLATGVQNIRTKEENLIRRFLDHLRSMGNGIEIYGVSDAKRMIPVVSFNVRNVVPSTAALYFEEEWDIMCRPGLHCAPAAHRTIGTFPQGAVRLSFGFFNTEADIDRAAEAVRALMERNPCG